MDILTQQQRHTVMSNIKSQDTSIEVCLRKALWHKGIRYRKNYKKLPGTPDIAITKYHIAIFCDGEFFHGFNWDEKKERLGNNRDFWIKKIERNIERDSETNKALAGMAWTVIRFWGNDILKNLNYCLDVIEEQILESLKNSVDDTS